MFVTSAAWAFFSINRNGMMTVLRGTRNTWKVQSIPWSNLWAAKHNASWHLSQLPMIVGQTGRFFCAFLVTMSSQALTGVLERCDFRPSMAYRRGVKVKCWTLFSSLLFGPSNGPFFDALKVAARISEWFFLVHAKHGRCRSVTYWCGVFS